MSESEQVPAARQRGASSAAAHRGRWQAALAGLVTLVLLAAVVVLATRPWEAGAPTPVSSDTGAAGAPPVLPSATSSPTAARTAGPVARSPVFTELTVGGLAVRTAELERTIPDASTGLQGAVPTELTAAPLPVGAVTPATCGLVRSVVADVPFTRSWAWHNEALEFTQDVTLLPDADAALAAFRALVTAVDACSSYTVNDETEAAWTVTTEPATEAQGRYPSLVQQRTVAGPAGQISAQWHGQVLVGNVVITWTAATLGAHADLGGLGAGSRIDTLMQSVALRAEAADAADAATAGPTTAAGPTATPTVTSGTGTG